MEARDGRAGTLCVGMSVSHFLYVEYEYVLDRPILTASPV